MSEQPVKVRIVRGLPFGVQLFLLLVGVTLLACVPLVSRWLEPDVVTQHNEKMSRVCNAPVRERGPDYDFDQCWEWRRSHPLD